MKSFLQDQMKSLTYSWCLHVPKKKVEPRRVSCDKRMYRCQDERSSSASWPSETTEEAVAYEILLQRDGVEQPTGLWHEPGGRVAAFGTRCSQLAAKSNTTDNVPIPRNRKRKTVPHTRIYLEIQTTNGIVRFTQEAWDVQELGTYLYLNKGSEGPPRAVPTLSFSSRYLKRKLLHLPGATPP